MDVTSAVAETQRRWAPRHIDTRAASVWALAMALVLYLAIDGGGYSVASHGEAGIVVWWLVVISAAWGLVPVVRPTRIAGGTVTLFAAFTAWTALGITWSISSGRSFQDLALVTTYLGVLVLAVMIHRDRAFALRHTVSAVASAIVVVALLALASRLWPHLFPASQQTGQFLAGTQSRLSWPLNYWNALATLMAIGIPLLLSLATSARTLTMQAAAAAAIPILALCDALTLSRGGALEAVIAVVIFLAFAPDRIPKLATAALAAAGSAVLVYGGLHRSAVQHGLSNAVERHQADTLIAAIALVCAGVAIAQLGVGLITRHGTLPRALTVSVSHARALTLATVAALVLVALAAGAPHRIVHTWDSFKNNVVTTGTNQTSASRFTSASGEGRYQFWVAAIDSAKGRVLTGSGPGTFQLDWLPRASFPSYVRNAHSLYVETYAELGLPGIAILAAFLLAALAAALRAVIRSSYAERAQSAAVVGAMLAFLLAAAFDWVWQMPVLPVAILLLTAAVLAPAQRTVLIGSTVSGSDFRVDVASGDKRTHSWPLIAQVATVVTGLACLVAIAYPLATSNAIAASQSAAVAGNLPQALADAQSAARLEPGFGAAQLQLALAFESQHEYGRAVVAAKHAVADDSQNWSNWVVLSRIEAEHGDAHAALLAYEQAKSLNPQSALFRKS